MTTRQFLKNRNLTGGQYHQGEDEIRWHAPESPQAEAAREAALRDAMRQSEADGNSNGATNTPAKSPQ
jgi:hypothetical protein